MDPPRFLDDVLRMTLNGMFVERIHLRDLTNSAGGGDAVRDGIE
jgi:hypothetical protein